MLLFSYYCIDIVDNKESLSNSYGSNILLDLAYGQLTSLIFLLTRYVDQ